jgi:adenylate cyclase
VKIRPSERMERKLAAILCADVYGYSRLMGEDEEATIRNLSAHRRTIDRLIEQHHGRFVSSAGDSVLAEFASAVNAVECAVEIQTALKTENAEVSPGRRMEFRIGVNLGDVVVEGGEIYGDGINVAARLESLAEPGSIYISASIHEQISNKLALDYEYLGEQHVKNIAKPVRVFRVLPNGTAPTLRERRHIPGSYLRRGALSLTGLAIVVGTIFVVQHLSLKPPRIHASIPPLAKPALPLPDIPSIAVLPFTNLSGDPQQEYFSDGISNQLIEDLSRLPGLFVIARNSSFAYKGNSTSEHEIGRELGVKYVLEGSVRRVPERVRIGVELVDASSGTERWTQHFDRPLKDLFAMQDEIIGKVVTTLGLLFKLDEMTLPHAGSFRPTDNLEAYDDHLRGVEYFWRQTKDDNAQARHWFQEAIELDPRFGEAYALLGRSYWIDVWSEWSAAPRADLQRASELAQKALALDDSNSTALALLSYVDWMQRRFDQAVADAERAVAINPNSAEDFDALATALGTAGKLEEALRAAEKAMRLDPARQDFYAAEAGVIYNEMGRYQEAVPFLKQALTAYPNHLSAHLAIIMAYVELGRDQDARAEAAEIMRISPHFAVAAGGPFKDEALNQRVRSDFHKAGLK